MPHPDEEQLLRYADGELAAGAAAKVRAHLEACWQCRAELEELQRTVGECVRYRKSLQEHLGTPPGPWGDIYRQFADIDASLDRVSLASRIAQSLASPLRHAKKWAPAAVVLAAVLAAFYTFRNTPSVQAAELLRKAVVAADVRSDQPRRIQIRTSSQRVTRVVGVKSTTASDSLTEVRDLFRKANYDWEDPLSAKSYRAWRDRLPDRQDEVTTLPDCYRIRTSTASGELAEATLKLSTRDLRPLEERFQFRDQEWMEITESAEDRAAPPSIAAADTGRESRIVPGAPRPPEMRSPAPAATVGDELQVLVALHNLGADLGDPVEVTRSGGQILVAGVGLEPERRQQIHDALSAMPNVVVRFSEPALAPARPEADASARASGSGDAALKARLEKQVGGRPNFEQFAGQLLDMSDIMMSRAYALRRLAERFPREAASELTSANSELLRKLYLEHATVLAGQVTEMERLLDPVLRPMGGRPEGALAAASPTWQLATEDLFRAARRVETLTAILLGVAPGETASENLPSQMLSTLAQLRASSANCQRLIAPGGK